VCHLREVYAFGAGPNDVNNPCSLNYIWSCHTGGLNLVFVDGSVHFLSYKTSQATICALATMANGEIAGDY
jgi:prepilin-type processing-associated H-X9-DG protein